MSMMTGSVESVKIHTLAERFNYVVRWIPDQVGNDKEVIWSLFGCHMNCSRAEHQAVDGYSLEPGFDQ
jgi:hypothetical protein